MTVLNFPNSPSVGDPHVQNGVTYQWDGVKWVANLSIVNPITISGDAKDISYTFPTGVKTTVQKRLENYVSVKDFGAVGDNSNDDLAAIQAAVNYCIENKAALYIPAGRYNCKGGTLYINHAGKKWTDTTTYPEKKANGLQIIGAGIMDGISAGSTSQVGTVLNACQVEIGIEAPDTGSDSDIESATDDWMMDALTIGNFAIRGRLLIKTVQASSNFFNLKVLPRDSSGTNGTITYGTSGSTFAWVNDIVSTSSFYNCIVGSGRVWSGNTLTSNASGVIFKRCRKVAWYSGRINNCYRAVQVGAGTTNAEKDIVYSLSMYNLYTEKPYKEAILLAQASNCYFQLTVNGQYVPSSKAQDVHDHTCPLVTVGGQNDSDSNPLPSSNVRSIRFGEGRLRIGSWSGNDYASAVAFDLKASENITIGNYRFQRVGIPVNVSADCNGYRLEGSDTFGDDTSGYVIDSSAVPIQWGGTSDFEDITTTKVQNVGYSGSNGGFRLQTSGNTDSSNQRSTLNMVSQQAATSSSLAFKINNSDSTAFQVSYDGKILMPILPTSASGLDSGQLWNNSGTLSIA